MVQNFMKTQRRLRYFLVATVLAASALLSAQANADIIHFTAYGTYTGSARTVDGIILITGATASQTYTLDTVTKIGSAVETIVSGTNTYQFTAIGMGLSTNSSDFYIGGGASPHTFGFDLDSPAAAPALQSDLNNLSEFFAAYDASGSIASHAVLYVTDNAPDFHLDSIAVPEPAAGALGVAGISLLTLGRRRIMSA